MSFVISSFRALLLLCAFSVSSAVEIFPQLPNRPTNAPALYRPSLTYSARDGLLPSFSATLFQSDSKSSVLIFSPFGFGSSPAARTASRNVGNSASTR